MHLSLKRRVNCKIARLRAGQIHIADEVLFVRAGCGASALSGLRKTNSPMSITALYESHRLAG
ncbi:hypothetical protein DL723_13355 [Shigella dysenteriae]|nr:hypothetical protein [Escherichia coli]EFX8385326.1 hypothetical protein [Shigella dysenteriae]RZM85601.1 hypothetical protein D9742_21040 [Escherichia sp. E1V33]TBR62948.1 hypothetical protein D9735_20515 [Escherichia sp. E1S7]EFO4691144.1 hypothetical protein [Escherichia coli]